MGRPIMNRNRAIALVTGLIVASAAATAGPERAESVWQYLGPPHAIAAERFSSLAEMARASDLVLVGRLVRADPGREFGDPSIDVIHYAAATVEVESVLGGSLPAHDFILELQMPGGDRAQDVVELNHRLPSDRGLFFLRSKAVIAVRSGMSPARQAAERDHFMPIIPRAVLFDNNGFVDIAPGADLPDYLQALADERFKDVVALVAKSIE